MTVKSPPAKTATKTAIKTPTASRKERVSEARSHAPVRTPSPRPHILEESPAAGAHAARHLVNEDATPGAGALPSHAHHSGKEVDGGAG